MTFIWVQVTLRGRHVTLQPFDASTDGDALFSASNGSAFMGHGPYDADDAIWLVLATEGCVRGFLWKLRKRVALRTSM